MPAILPTGSATRRGRIRCGSAKDRADREGWTVTTSFGDRAISGASLIRKGLQDLIAEAMAGRIEIVLTEALDRLNRDQADVATIYKQLSFAGVRIITLSEG